jgi:MFS family permease
LLQSLARRLPFYYGWLLVAVVFVSMGVAVNARTAFSLLYPPILDEFGWDRAVTAGVFSFGFLVSAILSPLIGRTMDSRGPRFVCMLGVVATGAGLLLATLTSQPWHLYLTLGVGVGAGSVVLGYSGQALWLPAWFVRRRGLALSLAFAGVGAQPRAQLAAPAVGQRHRCTSLQRRAAGPGRWHGWGALCFWPW